MDNKPKKQSKRQMEADALELMRRLMAMNDMLYTLYMISVARNRRLRRGVRKVGRPPKKI